MALASVNRRSWRPRAFIAFRILYRSASTFWNIIIYNVAYPIFSIFRLILNLMFFLLKRTLVRVAPYFISDINENVDCSIVYYLFFSWHEIVLLSYRVVKTTQSWTFIQGIHCKDCCQNITVWMFDRNRDSNIGVSVGRDYLFVQPMADGGRIYFYGPLRRLVAPVHIYFLWM